MKWTMKTTALLVAGCSFVLTSCATRMMEPIEGELLIPKDLVLSPLDMDKLENSSSQGDCEATYRLFEYYAYCTAEQKLAFEYAKLAYEQGCAKAKLDVENMRAAFGE